MQSTAKLLKNGRDQAVLLPNEFSFEGDEVAIRRDEETGEVILSRKEKNWDDFFRQLDELTQEERDAFVIPPRDRTPMRVPDLGD